MKNQVNDKEKLGSKLSEDEKKTITDAIEEKIKWLESNSDADTDDFKQQKKELEEIVHPIMTKFYQNAGGAGGEAPNAGGSESEDKDEL